MKFSTLGCIIIASSKLAHGSSSSLPMGIDNNPSINDCEWMSNCTQLAEIQNKTCGAYYDDPKGPKLMACICTLPEDYWNNMYQCIKCSPQIDTMDISANELSDTFKGEYCTSQTSSSAEFANPSSMPATLNVASPTNLKLWCLSISFLSLII